MRKYKLDKQKLFAIIREEITKALSVIEEDFNYHFSHGKEHDGRPYVSDNKFQMVGRDTGHFGSGTYFSTYRFDDSADIKQYNKERINEPNFIKIKDNVYRVDLDFYKNLYKVPNERWGNVLYTTLQNVNALYNRVSNGDYNCSRQYQIIKNNCSHIGLNCPSYLDFMRMAKIHTQNNSDIRSFSTVFMEWNGYNGVNVSGIFKFDNTLHGSVVYDLSKVGNDIQKVPQGDLDNFKYFMSLNGRGTSSSVAYDSDEDYNMMALDGKNEYKWLSKLNTFSPQQIKRLLKNYADSGNIIDSEYLDYINPSIMKWYLTFIFNSHEELCDNVISNFNYIDIIKEQNLWYWLNYNSDRTSVFVNLMKRFYGDLDWDLDDSQINTEMVKYMNFLKSKMSRDLNYIEEKYLISIGLK